MCGGDEEMQSSTRANAGAATSSSSADNGERHLVSGATAGLVATMVLHPLDLIKTRFHVQEHGGRRLPHYSGLVDACRSISAIEGWRGFYGGLLPNLIGNTASWGVYMYSYNRLKGSLGEQGMQGSALYLSAAGAAGALTTLLLHPVFTVKTRLQLQLNLATDATAASAPASASPSVASAGGKPAGAALPGSLLPASQRDNYTSSWTAVRRMIQEEGVLSLYRGFGPSMLLVSHGAIQFLAYEQVKGELLRRRRREELVAGRDADEAKLSAHDVLIASSTSKVCAILGTYPYQVVRSCMQQRLVIAGDAVTTFSTASGTVSHIWRVDGARGFYRGIAAHILRSTPQATLTLTLYEYGLLLYQYAAKL